MRLRPDALISTYKGVNSFQFYSSAIKTTVAHFNNGGYALFQFYSSAIKTLALAEYEYNLAVFQFYSSAIKTSIVLFLSSSTFFISIL